MATATNPTAQPRANSVPSAILESKLISETSLASECFIQQRFSSKLQIFLISYVNTIYSDYSVSV